MKAVDSNIQSMSKVLDIPRFKHIEVSETNTKES